MASKREQRLRRKARAALAAAVKAETLKTSKLVPIAQAAIRYVAEIDAPDLREPWSIDNRRRELVGVVHSQLGKNPDRRAGFHELPQVPGNRHLPVLGAGSQARAGEAGRRDPQQGAGGSERPGAPERAVQAAGEQHHHGRGTARGPGRFVTSATAEERAALVRDIELKKHELRLAAQKFGAVANDRGHRIDPAPLGEEVNRAARALARAETQLAIIDANARRSA